MLMAGDTQFYALQELATGAGWRSDASSKIVVWFGDAPGHDPICPAISGLASDTTEATATQALVDEEIVVLAISTPTEFYADGLDDDPTLNVGDYSGICAIGGSPGQATRIAAATGGLYDSNVPADEIADAILEGLGNLPVEVEMTSDCYDETGGVITTTFGPENPTTVTSGDQATFTETIAVAADAPSGIYTCTDYVWFNGEKQDFVETKTISVPEIWVTGGGNIVEGKGKNRVHRLSFGGNAGKVGDDGFKGQWSFNFHADGVKVHTTEITDFLVFDTGLDPAPPDADADSALVAGKARVNVGDGWVDGCDFLAGFQGGGEPEEDGVGIAVDCGDGITFEVDYLSGGNIQVHQQDPS